MSRVLFTVPLRTEGTEHNSIHSESGSDPKNDKITVYSECFFFFYGRVLEERALGVDSICKVEQPNTLIDFW